MLAVLFFFSISVFFFSQNRVPFLFFFEIVLFLSVTPLFASFFFFFLAYLMMILFPLCVEATPVKGFFFPSHDFFLQQESTPCVGPIWTSSCSFLS